jgi:hypothetical protein
LKVRVVSKSKNNDQWFEGLVSIPGLQETRLVRKSDQSTRYTSQSAVATAARSLAKTLGFESVELEKPVAKAAAKKAPKSTTQNS